MLNQTISHYQILERLGAGAMGEVYKAEDLLLNRTITLKFLPPHREYPLDEARRAAALNHPNIATIHELAEYDGFAFIVMEYIEGITLAKRLESSPLEIDKAIELAIQVAEALKATHARGLIHCDIKSSNIMLTSNGSVKVLDFGLAKFKAAESERGTVSGTLGYMSPEQAGGEKLDERTDIFSLGVIIYEMVTGRLPFSVESTKTFLQALLNNEPKTIGAYCEDVPLELESIVRKSLEKNREERYRSIEEMLSDLKRLGERLKTGLALPSLQTELKRPARRSQLWEQAARLLSRRRVSQSAPSLPRGAAFRGLLPFQEADRDRFYGREIDTLSLFDMTTIGESRFGVLFGESGCGKTSLLKAGLSPKLWEEGYVPIYCRSYNNPLSALAEVCSRQTQIKIWEGESTIDYLRRVAKELDGDLILVFDQFEEFFINFKTEREREPFISFVADCYHDTHLPVKFLFSMRSDFLYLINSEFAERIPEPLMSSRLYHLRNLSEQQAEEIIERSARQANIPFEIDLSRQAARDLAANSTVLPSELQILGEQLQKHRILSLQDYRRAGGKEALVHSFLEDVIHATADREGAHLVLRSLISDENTRLTLPLDEITRRVQRSRHKVEHLLKLFVQSRLIREIQEEEPWRYELIHEYLIEKINRITGKVMDATQRANRLFRQHLSGYNVDKRTRIPISKLWSIYRYSDFKRGEKEKELLRKSLWWGLLKSSLLLVVFSIAATIAAAALSVSEEWEEVRLSDGHTATVRRVAFSPDGRLLVSCGEDGKVIVWDFARRERLATFTDHTDRVTALAFSPDGKWFATGSDDRTVIVWDAKRLERVTVLRGHKERAFAVGFSPDGRLLASCSYSSQIILWDTSQWEKVRELKIGYNCSTVFFSTDGRQLLDHLGIKWNLTTGQKVADALGSNDGYGIALSPDAGLLVSVNGSGIVSFLDLARRRTLGNYQAHRDNGRAVAFSPDGRLVATGAEIILLWDVATETKLARLEYPAIVWSLAFSPDGRWLVSSHSDGAILLWDVAERERVANFSEHSGAVTAVAFSPDGKRLASASEDRSLIIWNLEQGQKEAVLAKHNTPVMAIAFSPDGRSVASTDFNGSIIYWDIAERRPRWIVDKLDHPMLPAGRCLAISPDGRWVAVSGKIYDSVDGKQSSIFPNSLQPNTVYSLAFSALGRSLATVTPDDGGKIYLWDYGNWQLLDSLKLENMPLLRVSFSPDCKLLATGEENNTIRLWGVGPLRKLALLGQHGARIKSVVFSPNGKQIASAGDDQTISLWDVERRRLITHIGTHTASVLSVAFSPDGQRLASGEEDRSVRIYTRHRTLWGHKLD